MLRRTEPDAEVQTSKAAAQQAWDRALQQYEKDFSTKSIQKIRESSGPQDVFVFLQERQEKETTSKYYRWLHKERDFFARFEKYQSLLDLLVPGAGGPGSLIWGSIKMVLSVSRFRTISQYQQLRINGLCNARLSKDMQKFMESF